MLLHLAALTVHTARKKYKFNCPGIQYKKLRHGRRLNREKSGARLSRYACRPCTRTSEAADMTLQ